MNYELKNINELTEYIFNFWINWGIPEYPGTDDDLKNEIYTNLQSKEGIEKELDSIRCEFDAAYDENSKEYQDLDKIWNYINWYKTDFYKKEDKINEKSNI